MGRQLCRGHLPSGTRYLRRPGCAGAGTYRREKGIFEGIVLGVLGQIELVPDRGEAEVNVLLPGGSRFCLAS